MKQEEDYLGQQTMQAPCQKSYYLKIILNRKKQTKEKKPQHTFLILLPNVFPCVEQVIWNRLLNSFGIDLDLQRLADVKNSKKTGHTC